MVRWLYALSGAFKQQWKTNADIRRDPLGLVANVPLVAIIAWIATNSDRPGVLAYLAIGVFLMTLWNQTQIAMRWTIIHEAFGGTLEFNLLARVPLMMLLLGKALAHAASGMLPAVVAFATAVLIAQRAPEPESVLGVIAAVGTALLAVLATAFIFAPMQVLAARQLDSVAALRPFVVVFSGFLYPVSFLPPVLEGFARLLPTSWAMSGLTRALNDGATAAMAADLLLSLGLSVAYLTAAYVMLGLVERRVRSNAALVV